MSRFRFLTLLLLGSLLTPPMQAWGEDPPVPAPAPAPEPPAAPEAPVREDVPIEESALAAPAQAWRDLQKELSDPAKRRPNALEEGAKAYLAAWEARKREPASEDLHALGLFLNAAQRTPEATPLFERSAQCETLPALQRSMSAVAWANAAVKRAREGELKGEAAAAALAKVESWLPLAPAGAQRAYLLSGKGALLLATERLDEALEAFALAGEASPDEAAAMASLGGRALLERCQDLAQVEPARARFAALAKRLTDAQQLAIGQNSKALDAATDEKQKTLLTQALKRGEARIGQIASQGRPFELLGGAAPAWTLEKAYGTGQALSDYQGKVVVLDFWATWCPWCIRSFPALRDLLKDYAGQDLVVVGVTTSSASVYEARYDLDDDLKAKASGAPVKPILLRPRLPSALKPDADDAAKAAFEAAKAAHPAALAEFKAKEQEILATFIANHAMSWDVVVIDEQEPGPKYALGGWPHCVVIDRQGRIRHFKSGALLREKPEAVAAFRKIIDGLLVEPAKEP